MAEPVQVSSPTPDPGGQQPAAETPAPIQQPSNDDPVGTLRFDAFAQGAKRSPDGVAQVEKNAVPAVGKPQAPASNQPSPELMSQAEQIQALLTSQAATQPQQPLPQPGQQQQADPHDWQPGFNIPDQLFAAVTSQDPAQVRQGLNALVNGLAAVTYKQSLSVVRDYVGQLLENIPHMIEAHSTQRALQEKFYGAHKDLNNPQIKETVTKVAGTIAQQYKALGKPVDVMDPTFHELVAYTTRKILGIPQPNGQAAPGQTQPFIATPGSRPAGAGHREEDMMASIGL